MIPFETNIIPLFISYYEVGRALYYQKKFAEALEYFTKAEANFENTGNPLNLHLIHYALGKTYHELEKDHESLENYFKAFMEDPLHNPDIIKEAQQILNDALAQQQLNFCKNWVHKLKSLKVSAEAQQELSILLGRIYMYNEKTEDDRHAEEEFNYVLQQNPGHLYALENLGELYRRFRRYDEALRLFNKVSAEDITGKRKDFINLKKALLYFDKGEYERVLYFTNDLSFQHKYYKMLVQKMRAKSFLCINEPEKAKQEADTILINDEKNLELILIKAVAYLYLGDYANALFYLNKCLADDSNKEEYLFYKAEALIESFIDIEQGKKILEQLSQDFISNMLVQKTQVTTENKGNDLLFFACLQSVSEDNIISDKALITLEDAIKAGIKAKNTYPELYAYQLKGDILAAKNQAEKAGEAYFDAAKRLYWQTDYKEATVYFQKALEQKNNNAIIFWYCADNYLMQSFLPAFPFSDKQMLDYADKDWKKGIELRLPYINETWCFVTKARIHELRNNYTIGTDQEEFRKALYYTEQSVFLNDNDYYNLVFLARYMNFCGLDVNALAILNKAEEKDKDSILIKEEKTTTLLNLGYWQQALHYLKALDDEEKKPEFDGWRGYIDFHKGNFENALNYFDKAIEAAPENAWNQQMHIQTLWHLNNDGNYPDYNEALLKNAHWLYSQKDKEPYRKEALSIAFASIFAETDIHSTEQLFKSLLIEDDQKPLAHLYLSYLYLKNGLKEPAVENFNEYFKYAGNSRELIAVKADISMIVAEAVLKFPELREWFRQITNEEDSSKTSWFTKINEALNQLQKNPINSVREIEEKLKKNSNYKPGTFGYKALSLRLAQLKLEEWNYREAIDIYASLLPANDEEIFTTENLSVKLNGAIKEMKRFWQLKDYISKMLAADLLNNEEVKNFYGELLSQLQMPLHEEYSLKKDIDLLPEVTPLVVEIAVNLVPEDTSNWTLLNDGFPKLRQELLEAYGVRIPGIRIRGNEGDLPADSYIIMLDEVPLVLNYLYTGYVYCPNAEETNLKKLGIQDSDYKKNYLDENNKISTTSFWVKEEHSYILKQSDVEVHEDSFYFLLKHLKFFISKNLAEFFNIDDCHELVKELHKKTPSHDVLEDLEVDILKRVKFTEILKALLYERVPINDFSLIVNTLNRDDLDTPDISVVVSKLREVIKEHLPNNDANAKRISLPEEIENKIAIYLVEDEEEKIALVIPPNVAQEIILEFSSFINKHPSAKVIVLENSFHRIYAKRLFEIEFPGIDFLSSNEVITERKSIPRKREDPILLKNSLVVQAEQGSSHTNSEVCPQCKHPVKNDWKFCQNCGFNLPTPSKPNVQQDLKIDPQKIIGSSNK